MKTLRWDDISYTELHTMVAQSHSELLRHNCKKKRSNYGVKGEETLKFLFVFLKTFLKTLER